MNENFYKVSGLGGASYLHFIAKHLDEGLIVLPSSQNLDALKSYLQFFLLDQQKHTQVLVFPEFERGFEPVREDPQIVVQRLETQRRLLNQKSKEPVFILTTLLALSQRTIFPKDLESAIFTIKRGSWLSRDELVVKLREIGFRQDDLAEDQGFFSVRGHLVDIFSPYELHPYRLEFFGDEIVSIRTFDPDTQRSLQDLEEIELLPCREIIVTPQRMKAAKETLKDLGDEKKIDREERVRIVSDLEHHREVIGERWLLPAFFDRLGSLSDYLPKHLCPIFVDSMRAQMELESSWKREDQDFVHLNRLSFGPGSLRAPVDSILDEPAHRLETTVGNDSYHILLQEGLRGKLVAAKSFKPLQNLLHELEEQAITTTIVCQTEKRLHAVREGLQDSKLSLDLRIGPPLPSFSSTTFKRAFITEREIFGIRRKKSRAPIVGAEDFLKQFSDVGNGDLVIHEDHGVAKFHGLTTLNLKGVTSEFLLLEYADQDKLYLPIYYIEKVSRYLGDGARLDRLGSTVFSKRKTKIKKDILRIAHDLLEIAASRKLIDVKRRSIDESMYQDFCAEFPYELTTGQEKAVLDTEEDLKNSQPMDRLICGDVGFGKTEVALRAAMLTMLSGKQVAILAPTTLLVEQHAQNFKKRFSNYPFRIANLSRFVSSADQKKTIDGLREGSIDLVIGTHRLLQKDVALKNLGTLIIDEEQRFGVKHKERIKSLRTGCDVLTLSATPIPRTLQLSIVGVRELSVIATAPDIREAVKTYVGAFDPDLIQKACLKERDRGGQIFFVHNRVKSIESFAERIQEILPDFKILIAHGQMDEKALESRVVDFMNQKADILMATSIIENGIDMPNVNTLFIDHAEQFGLSDLYQLRGRVGRSHRSAAAYLLIHDETPLTDEASKRLQVIQSCTELGSGFKVATHDLEIRGGGNILGEEQSGIITEIGLELYNQMLQETLNEIREHESLRPLPELNSGYTAYIPADYIPDASIRISTYKQLNRTRTQRDLLNFEEELLDRFGLYPESVENLCRLQRLRTLAWALRAKSLDIYPGKLSLALDDGTPLEPSKIISRLGKDLQVDTKGRLIFRFLSALKADLKNPSSEKEDFILCHELLTELCQLAEVPLENV